MTRPVKRSTRQKKEINTTGPWWMNIRVVSGLIAALAFILYSNSLTNGFVLDDPLVITKNDFTNKGVSGIGSIFSNDTFQGYYGSSASELKVIGGRYRPLSLAFFAFLYQLFGASPFAFHLWNVLLYSICCAFLYFVLRKSFESNLGSTNAAVFSGLTALFFTVHPVHTEVVDNIKSNDEILCLLLSLTSLYLAVRYWDTQRKSHAWMSGIALFLACLAKENAVVFLAIIPFTLYFRQKTIKKKRPSIMPLMTALGISFLFYFIIRYSVLGWSLGDAPLDLINNPFIKFTGETWIHCTLHEKLAMTFWSLGKYLQLLVFPYALTTDYYPRFVDVMTFSNPVALISLLTYLALAVFAAYKIWKKENTMVVYGIVFFLVALSIISNLVFPIGTNLAERFLFTPSVGFCIAIVGLIFPYIIRQERFSKPFLILFGALLVLLSVRTFIRNFDFESNKVLMMKDIKVSEKSAKIQNASGALIAEEALNIQDQSQKIELSQQAMIHLNKAIEIHPTYLEAFYMRGNVFFMQGQYEKAIQDYRKTISLNENFKDVYTNYALALREGGRSIIENRGDMATAILYLEESLKLFPNELETASLLDRARSLAGQR